MLRIGKIVTQDKNPLMNVSAGYEQVVRVLSMFEFKDDETRFLACLILSQTEERYKDYLLTVIPDFEKLPLKDLITAWQENNFSFQDDRFSTLFNKSEFELLKKLDIEDHLEEYEPKYPELFKQGLSWEFYPTKKKGMVILQRAIKHYLPKLSEMDDQHKLVLHFVAAQLLISWESSCIHLGKMILNGWPLEQMREWFCSVWPIYAK